MQVCRSLPDYETIKYAVFLDKFFTNTRLFKALKTIGIGACGTAKSGCEYSADLFTSELIAGEGFSMLSKGLC
jgi:hypothetical protein